MVLMKIFRERLLSQSLQNHQKVIEWKVYDYLSKICQLDFNEFQNILKLLITKFCNWHLYFINHHKLICYDLYFVLLCIVITQQKIILQKFENIWMLQYIKIGRDQASIYQYLGFFFFGIHYRYTDISIIISIVKFWNRSLNMNIFNTILINLSFHQKHFWYTKQIDLYSW